MHLKNYPTYFIKDGKRRAVYHTVAARELTEAGWVAEGTVVVPSKENEAPQEPETVTVEKPITQTVQAQGPVVQAAVQVEGTANASLDEMTRVELMEFAEANGVEFKSNALKADILEACKEFADD